MERSRRREEERKVRKDWSMKWRKEKRKRNKRGSWTRRKMSTRIYK